MIRHILAFLLPIVYIAISVLSILVYHLWSLPSHTGRRINSLSFEYNLKLAFPSLNHLNFDLNKTLTYGHIHKYIDCSIDQNASVYTLEYQNNQLENNLINELACLANFTDLSVNRQYYAGKYNKTDSMQANVTIVYKCSTILRYGSNLKCAIVYTRLGLAILYMLTVVVMTARLNEQTACACYTRLILDFIRLVIITLTCEILFGFIYKEYYTSIYELKIQYIYICILVVQFLLSVSNVKRNSERLKSYKRVKSSSCTRVILCSFVLVCLLGFLISRFYTYSSLFPFFKRIDHKSIKIAEIHLDIGEKLIFVFAYIIGPLLIEFFTYVSLVFNTCFV